MTRNGGFFCYDIPESSILPVEIGRFIRILFNGAELIAL
jgi:hypothetical protein